MLSLVIPIFNEEQIIDELLTRTVKAVESITADYEIIFVDDGSTDNSSEQILNYRKKNSRIKLLSLSRNFGHQVLTRRDLNIQKAI
jgi:dolichol-phosphate mannosyltransferase